MSSAPHVHPQGPAPPMVYLHPVQGPPGPYPQAQPEAPPMQPVGTAIQISTDYILAILEEEKALAVASERTRRLELQHHYDQYRAQREAQAAKDAKEIEAHVRQINHLTAQLTDAKRRLKKQEESGPGGSSHSTLTARNAELEASLEAARRETEQVRREAQTSKGHVTELITIMHQVGIYSSQPGTFYFGNHWPVLLAELGVNMDKSWTAADLDLCLHQAVEQIRQNRRPPQPYPQQHPPPHYSHPPSAP